MEKNSFLATGAMFELSPILIQDGDFSPAGPDGSDQIPMQLARWFRQPVMNPESLFPADHQSSLPEISQMARDRGLRQVESFMKMADAHFTIGQEIQKP